MFWKKEKPVGSPRELDRTLARIIGREWSKFTLGDSDHWVKYMSVMRQHGDSEDVFDVRVYDEGFADQKKIKVVDYSSLEHHPELIIFEGWFDRKNKKGDIHFNDMHFKKAA